jgi:hypothetical protein
MLETRLGAEGWFAAEKCMGTERAMAEDGARVLDIQTAEFFTGYIRLF